MTVTSRTAAVVGLVLLVAALTGVLVLTTPWQPLPGSVPGGREQVQVRRDFTAAQIAREVAYHHAVRPPAYASLVLGLLLALVLGLTPLGARLVHAVARPLGGGWGWQVVVGGLAVALLGRLVSLPFDLRTEVVLRHYGLSTQSWGGWTVDQLRGLAVGGLPMLLALLGFFALVHRFPGAWWAPVGAGAALLVIVISFAYPLVVEPVFNKFTPLPAGPQRAALLELAREDHQHVSQVLVADASRRTTALNAYVSGFGSTKRIVVYDTLLRSASPEEVRLVVAHELGHAKRQDVLHGTIEGALGAAAAACLLFLLLSWPALLHRAGVSSAGDARALPLVLALVTLLSTLTSPVQMLVSRRIESRADVHSLDLTRDPAGFVASEKRLAVTNLSDLSPSPLVYGLFFDHPTSPERVALARDWARQQHVPVP